MTVLALYALTVPAVILTARNWGRAMAHRP